MRFRIDLKIFLFLILFYFTKQIETYVMIIFFAIIHELGHLIAGLLMGMKPEKVELKPYGVSISFFITSKDYNKKIKKSNLLEIKKILVALAGPLTNLIIIFIAINSKINVFSNLIILYSNLLLLIFNLIPIYPLDGRKNFKGNFICIFWKKKSRNINKFNLFCYFDFCNFFSKLRCILYEKYFNFFNYNFFMDFLFRTG